MHFPKCTFSGPQLNRLGLVWYLLNLSKAHAPRGLDYNMRAHFTNSINNMMHYPTPDTILGQTCHNKHSDSKIHSSDPADSTK